MKRYPIFVLIYIVTVSCITTNQKECSVDPESFEIDSLISPFDIPDVEERYDTEALGWHIIFRRMSEDKPIYTKNVYDDTTYIHPTGEYNTVLHLHVRHNGHDLIPLYSLRANSFPKLSPFNPRKGAPVDINSVTIQSPKKIKITKDSIILFVNIDNTNYERIAGTKVIVHKDGTLAYKEYDEDEYNIYTESYEASPFYDYLTGNRVRFFIERDYMNCHDFRSLKYQRFIDMNREIDVVMRIYRGRPGLLDSLVTLLRTCQADDDWTRICMDEYADEIQRRMSIK